MQTLTATDEQNLINGVKTAVDLVDNKGLSPDEALIKVARDSQYTPGFVRAAVSAFNNGRQLAQFKANDNILDKLAEFQLADYDTIHDAIWGGSVKEARDQYQYAAGSVHADYSQPPAWLAKQQREKTASAPLNYPPLPALEPYAPDNTRKMIVKYSDHQRVKQAFELQRGKYASAHDNVNLRMHLLENYFNKLAMDRLPFHQVDYAAQTYFGDHGKSLMDYLAVKFPKEKRAADTRICYDKPVDLKAAPYSYIQNVITAATEVYQTKVALDAAYVAMEKSAEELSPFGVAPSNPNPLAPVSISLLGDDTVKTASWLGGAAIASGTKSMLDRALGPQARNQEVEKAWLDLEDPDHNNEIRKIRAQTMLNGMLSDPDNPISGYDPDQVLNAFNELSQLAPRVSEQPAAMQPLLAKRLAGHREPFEVKEITDMEKGLKDARATTPSTSIMTNAPNAILG